MKKTIKKGDAEFNLFADFWKLYTDYGIPEDNNKYWQGLINATDEFVKKYNGSRFAKDLSLAVADELERQYKNKRGK